MTSGAAQRINLFMTSWLHQVWSIEYALHESKVINPIFKRRRNNPVIVCKLTRWIQCARHSKCTLNAFNVMCNASEVHWSRICPIHCLSGCNNLPKFAPSCQKIFRCHWIEFVLGFIQARIVLLMWVSEVLQKTWHGRKALDHRFLYQVSCLFSI